MIDREQYNVAVPNPNITQQRAEKVDFGPTTPIAAQFLNVILRDHKDLLSNFSKKHIILPVLYWGQPNISYEDVGRQIGVSKQRVQQVVRVTMESLWKMSPDDIKATYPLEEVVKGKCRVPIQKAIITKQKYQPLNYFERKPPAA